MPGPLHGLTVLDLSTEVSGPFCTKLLADYGADVIKVEPPGGDPSRAVGPSPADGPHPERSPLFLYLNTNKRSVVLDLETAAGREAAVRLAAAADVVVENFAPGRLAALGLGWPMLRARNPALVLTSITPFGQDGPYAGYAATNLTAYAMGGQMKMTGDPEREPLKAGGEQADYQAGLNAFAATAVAALGARLRGRGEHLDIGAMQCMASTLELTGPLWAYRGIDTSLRRGNVMSAAIGLYECADGYLGIHAMPRNWAPLAETMQMPELAEDDRYRTGRARLEHNDELVAILTGWAADQEKKAIYERAGGLRGPIAYVHTMADLLASPQLAARGYFRTVDHPATGPLTYPGPPFTMTASPARAGRAPLLNEHADDVLGRAGMREFRRSEAVPPPDLTPARPHACTPELPLAGIRVLDLTMVWAGPYATRLLGDMGAEVIKVESVRFWDLLRQLHTLGPEAERGWNKSAYFNHNNRDKYAVSLDLTDDEGRALCLRLAAQCDVVIENYRADVLDRLGLGYEALRAVRPDIILVSMPGHGKDGPERDYVAYGTNVEQLAGLVSLTGYEGGPPHKSGISYGDPTAGIAAAGAVALALHHRLRTGEGQYVELAQRENLTALLGEHVVAYGMTGRLPERTGNRHPEWAPHGVYRCDGNREEGTGNSGELGSADDDAWVALACRSDAEFAALCGVIGQPDLAADPRFRAQATRHAHQAELVEPITAWTLGRTHREAMTALQAAGIPAGAVLSAPELFADGHLRARGFWEQIAHPEAGVWDVDGVAWRLRDNPAHIRVPAPRFAEHNRYVLGDLLGLTADEIAALEASGVAGTEPDTGVHQ